MSFSDKVSHLLDSIILLSKIIATMISTVKFERNNRPFTIEDILKGEFNWNMYEITLPCYVMNICILYQFHFKQHDFLKEVLIGYTHANFHHATTFGCRHIAFQIWWLPCNPHRITSGLKLFLSGVYCAYVCYHVDFSKCKQCIKHIYYNAPFCNAFCTKWCIVEYATGAQWDLRNRSISPHTRFHAVSRLSKCVNKWFTLCCIFCC